MAGISRTGRGSSRSSGQSFTLEKSELLGLQPCVDAFGLSASTDNGEYLACLIPLTSPVYFSCAGCISHSPSL